MFEEEQKPEGETPEEPPLDDPGFKEDFEIKMAKEFLLKANHSKGSTMLDAGISYLREEVPLGTGGALGLLTELPSHPLLVMNGDIVSTFDAGNMLRFHDRGGFAATMAVHEYVHNIPFGVANVEGDRLVRLAEKPTRSWSINAGIGWGF